MRLWEEDVCINRKKAFGQDLETNKKPRQGRTTERDTDRTIIPVAFASNIIPVTSLIYVYLEDVCGACLEF